ncbi:MAG: hypothetical protein OET55_04865 [Desulfuromonadales bacterium]|jgi:hypothetical protein|nr:hypothetical protein [Desulfuromonadales bacterium]MDH3807859.1 hypothetical protein [Desulfuromonadales bacterium]MDH3869275.1 hypothetical protein [Desulfuromonadales bacterium]MDH3960588.1 hypothetical protein [Desulfuromonadales bacterium]MDH4025749.1 hypothetical protein [Desulfuromonadales bacterium]
MLILRPLATLMLLVALSLPTTGCMPTVGEAFPFYKVRQIEVEKTTMAEIREMFGEPWRTGLENGERTWTYGEYGVNISRDLVIRYDDRNVVKSYSFSSSEPEDANL